jgi:hypothetical protein
MCRKPCCPPQRSSGTAGLIAIIAAIAIAASVLRAIFGLLVTLIEITLITTVALIVLGLVTWALVRRHRRTANTGSHAAVLARRSYPLAPGYVPVTASKPATPLPGTTRGPELVSREHAVRHFADVIAGCDDPAAVDDLIRLALHGRHT